MIVVIDTNVIVSAFWSKSGISANVLNLMLNEVIRPCYDARILIEYSKVLFRPHFKFPPENVVSLLSKIEEFGVSVTPAPVSLPFTDIKDKKFYEVAKHCNAILITGNGRHFPQEPNIVTPAEFLNKIIFSGDDQS
ncbi:MAG: putative toxin-antitoxin system toxin component, PIN family [Oscillospiraceae bacterium]|nr:putative toxin-antitoxin system toxin component, PIN family [Oscillospiraceae bacterium]